MCTPLPHLSTSITHGFPLHLHNRHHPRGCNKHMHPHFNICSQFSAIVPSWPLPSWECLPHKSQVQQIRARWLTPPLFAPPLPYYPHISQTNFPKLSRFLQQLKNFSHSLLLSSQSFWQEAWPCWSGCLSVPGPKLTQPIERGNHDLTNKRNRGLQQGGCLGFEEQWESHRACHCFSTTDRFWQLSGLFFPKPKEPSCSGKPSEKRHREVAVKIRSICVAWGLLAYCIELEYKPSSGVKGWWWGNECSDVYWGCSLWKFTW